MRCSRCGKKINYNSRICDECKEKLRTVWNGKDPLQGVLAIRQIRSSFWLGLTGCVTGVLSAAFFLRLLFLNGDLYQGQFLFYSLFSVVFGIMGLLCGFFAARGYWIIKKDLNIRYKPALILGLIGLVVSGIVLIPLIVVVFIHREYL